VALLEIRHVRAELPGARQLLVNPSSLFLRIPAIRARMPAGTPPALCSGVMSISVRATHILSTMLIVIVACSGSAWASTDRTAHCPAPMHACHEVDVITCCGPSAPAPIGQVQLPEAASSLTHVQAAPLMDESVPQAPRVRGAHVPSPHWVRVLDLPTLHRSFVI